MYLHTKNEVLTSRLSKDLARTGQTNMHADRRTDRRNRMHYQPHSYVVKLDAHMRTDVQISELFNLTMI